MLVTIERSQCTSCGDCVLSAPEVFDLDEGDALVVLLEQHPPPELHAAVRRAVLECPADVIATDD